MSFRRLLIGLTGVILIICLNDKLSAEIVPQNGAVETKRIAVLILPQSARIYVVKRLTAFFMIDSTLFAATPYSATALFTRSSGVA